MSSEHIARRSSLISSEADRLRRLQLLVFRRGESVGGTLEAVLPANV